MVKERGRQVLQRRVELAVLHGQHGVGGAVESNDFDVRPAFFRWQTYRPPSSTSTPTFQRPPPGFSCLRSAQLRIAAAALRHQLQLIDIVRDESPGSRDRAPASTRIR